MKRAIASMIVTLLSAGIGVSTASAQVEQIGPFDMFGAADVKVLGPYDNVIPPNPVEKLFEFIGTAVNPAGGPAGQPRTLVISFGYMDNGAPVYLPGHPVTWSHGNLQPISVTDVLNFCPEKVLMRFETTAGSITDIRGTFLHDCHGEIPTLSEWGALIFGALLLGSVAFYVSRRRKAALER